MRKLRVYQYPDTPADIYEQSGYIDCIPFSRQGIERWCEMVDPKDAELFLAGQYHDKNSWMLEPERFEFFKGREEKHYFDIEGDWANKKIPEWLRPAIITAMNAEPNHRNWNCFVRPGCSTLLMDMVRNPRPYTEPEKVGFFFMGQRDPNGLREKVREAFIKADVPGEFIWTSKWNAPSSLDDQDVREYEEGLRRWSFALCPAGTGQMTVRFFEVCALGRIPIVIADNLLFLDESTNFALRISTDFQTERMSRLLTVLMRDFEGRNYPLRAHSCFSLIKYYFGDPTLFFLKVLEARGYVVL